MRILKLLMIGLLVAPAAQAYETGRMDSAVEVTSSRSSIKVELK